MNLRNADGFGVGWYAQQAPLPCVFTSLKPVLRICIPKLRSYSEGSSFTGIPTSQLKKMGLGGGNVCIFFHFWPGQICRDVFFRCPNPWSFFKRSFPQNWGMERSQPSQFVGWGAVSVPFFSGWGRRSGRVEMCRWWLLVSLRLKILWLKIFTCWFFRSQVTWIVTYSF